MEKEWTETEEEWTQAEHSLHYNVGVKDTCKCM